MKIQLKFSDTIKENKAKAMRKWVGRETKNDVKFGNCKQK